MKCFKTERNDNFISNKKRGEVKMKNVFEILSQVGATSSRNEKEDILKRNSSNELLKKTLLYTFDPYRIYGIGAKSIHFGELFNADTDSIETDIFSLLDWLSKNNGGSDFAKMKVNKFLSMCPAEDAEWYKRMILKDLLIGATDGTTNKAFQNLIPTFDVMLAKKFEEHEHKIKGDFIISTKLDGVRNVALKDAGSIKLLSRQGKVFEDFNELLEEIKLLPDDYAYDGEFLVINPSGLDSKDLYRETMKEVSKKGVKTNVEFHIFDMIPIQEFKDGKSKKKCIERKTILHHALKQFNFNFIKEVPVLYQGKDKSKVFELLDKEISKGLEGVMVNLDAVYSCTRSDAILKVKKFHDADCLCLGVEEGTNKNVGKLGSILIQFEHNGGLHTCNVGSGFSDSERELYYNNPELIIGKIVTIGYFELTQNQKELDSYSMRFPTWKSIIRHDKTEISMH
jgi:DNA ligase-1